MKTHQIYFIYTYDSIKGWTKCSASVNPKDGFDYEEDATSSLMHLADTYPNKEFTILPVYVSR